MKTVQLLLLLLLTASWNPFLVEVEEVKKGNAHLKAYEYKEAETKYKTAQEKRASSLRLKYNLGLVYMGLADWSSAEKSMIDATGSDDAEMRRMATYFSGIIRFHLGDIARDNKDPQKPGAHIPKAKLKYTEALANFKKVLEADPASDEARYNFELTLERLEELEQEKDRQQKKKEQKEKKREKEKKKDQKKKDKNKQNNKKNKKKNDPSKGKKDPKSKNQKNDPNKKDKKQQDPNKKDQKKSNEKKPDPKKQQSPQKRDPNKKNSQSKPQPKPSQQKKRETPQQRAARKALKDLKERQRQRLRELYQRQGAGRRTPIKDW